MSRKVCRESTARNGAVVWRAIVDLGRDPATGKRRQRRISAATRVDCEKAVVTLRARALTGAIVTPSTRPLGPYLMEWLDGLTGVKGATRYAYRGAARNGYADIWHTPLAHVTPARLRLLYARQIEAGRHPNTIRVAHTVLRRAFADAVRDGLLPTDPTATVTPPRKESYKATPWTPAQTAVFFATIDPNDAYSRVWCVLAGTMMRVGEVLALRWDDVDLAAAELHVRRTITRTADGITTGPPKSERSTRVVPLLPAVVDALKAQRQDQLARRLAAPVWVDHNLVFDRGDGTLLGTPGVNDHWHRAVAAAGLPPIRLHDLRHGGATALNEADVDLKTLSLLLGHSDVATTARLYVHPSGHGKRRAIERLRGMFGDVREAAED